MGWFLSTRNWRRKGVAGAALCACVAALMVFAAPALAHETSGADKVVHLTTEGFEPRSLEVEAGEKVVFENADVEGHWPASDDHPMHDGYPGFDPQKPVEPGKEWSFTFEKPGEWGYHDHMNPMLEGEIVVRGEGGILASIGNLFAALLSVLPSGGDGAKEAPHEEVDQDREDPKKRYAALVRERDPRFALNQLGKDMEADEQLLRSCHPVVHEVGNVAYEKYGDFGEAMKYQDEVCNSGYVHGVIEERFARSDDVLSDMKTMCERYEPGGYLAWQCYHGIGHGVMYYTSNRLPEALEMCDAFEDDFGSSSCYNGVFMENFGADGELHVSEYVKEGEPLYPCAQQKTRHKADCYLYAPTHYLNSNAGDYAGALEVCEEAEPLFRATCAGGVGSQAMKENLDEPKLVESVCEKGDSDQTEPCIKGMASLYANHHGSLEPARELCGQLEVPNREACLDTVRAMAPMFEA